MLYTYHDLKTRPGENVKSSQSEIHAEYVTPVY